MPASGSFDGRRGGAPGRGSSRRYGRTPTWGDVAAPERGGADALGPTGGGRAAARLRAVPFATAAGRRRRTEAARERRALLTVRVGPHRLAFDLRTILAIEGRSERVEHEAIVGPVDLRRWLDVAPAIHDDTVLVPGADAVYRLLVCAITGLASCDLRDVHRLPAVLEPLGARLCLRGAIETADGLAFIADAGRLAAAAWAEQRVARPADGPRDGGPP